MLQNYMLIISTLVTCAIISMDLGVPYSPSELTVYTSPFFQIIAVLSVATQAKDLNFGIMITLIWLGIKYFHKFTHHKEYIE